MLEQIEGQNETIRELNEQIAVLEAAKKEVEKKKAKAWTIIYAKNKEAKDLKEKLDHELNKNAKLELRLKKNALKLEYTSRLIFSLFPVVVSKCVLFYFC